MAGPGGRSWGDTTIRGQRDRGTGLLNNELYVGRLVWNRCSYVKDPRTGKRLARPNPPDQWEVVEVPELRIIADDLWERVKARQKDVCFEIAKDADGNALNRSHRRRYLFSGLLKCGICGGGYTIIGLERYGCATRRSKGTCANDRTIKRRAIEERVLSGLEDRLMAPELVEAFVEEYRKETNRLAAAAEQGRFANERSLAAVERKIKSILKAVEDGMYNPSMKDRLTDLEARKAELGSTLAAPRPGPLRLHPNLPHVYRDKVANLVAALNDESIKAEAMELIRSLVDKVVLSPDGESPNLNAILHGDLATILAFCEGAKDKQRQPAESEY